MTPESPRPSCVTALVAEDEPILRADLQSRLAALWPELKLVAAAANGREALALYDAHRPDVTFLDVEMPIVNGLEVARQLSGRCHIVFVTAYDAHAVAAFERGAVDYVLKPYDDARLGVSLGRLRERLETSPRAMEQLIRELALAARPKPHLQWIKASRGAEIDLIMVGDVAYFQAEDKYTTVFTQDREATIRRSIKELAAELDPQKFWQIHRSTIVNLEAVASVSKGLTGTSVKLRGRPQRLAVSDAYRHLFKHM